MLKGFVSGVEKDIKRIPMKGQNLWGGDVPKYGYTNDYKKYNPDNAIALKAGTYTISSDGKLPIIQVFDANLTQLNVDGTITDVSGYYKMWDGLAIGPKSSTVHAVTITLLYDYILTFTVTDTLGTYIMLNSGSTALPYEPYGYQEGWEVRDNQDRLIWGREDELQTATGTLPFKGYSLPVKVKSLLGNAVQNGTPAPDNIITPEMCGVRTGNLAKYWQNAYVRATDGAVVSQQRNGMAYPVSVSAGQTITFSANTDNFSIGIAVFRDFDGTTPSDMIFRELTGYTYTATENCYVVVWCNYDNTTIMSESNFDLCKAMLNLGTTALPYEPYGWKVPFENHGENLLDESASSDADATHINYNKGTPVILTAGQTYTFSCNTTCNGLYIRNVADDSSLASTNNSSTLTYTPQANVSAYFRIWNSNGIANLNPMFNLGSTPKPYSPYLNEIIPVYLGEVPTVRRVKKLVLDGTENWSSYSGVVYLSDVIDYLKTDAAVAICTHYQPQSSVEGVSETVAGHIAFSKGSNFRLCIRDTDYTSGAAFKTYLAAQYAAGHPVTVWYVLANEQTGIVNEPLCKISKYADELTTIQVHGLSAPLCGIGDYKDTLNLSTGVVTRKVKKLVLTGSESTDRYVHANTVGFAVKNLLDANYNRAPGICSHYEVDTRGWIDRLWIGVQNKILYFVGIGDVLGIDTATEFKSYLAAQYAAGTPVTIWYVLNTPTTETVTVPTGMTGEIEGYLTQISTSTPEHPSIPKWNGKEETGGTYAVTVYTPPEIPTTTGKNTLTVDTTIAPYDVTINGHIKYTYWGKIREDVRSGLAQTKFPVGTILYDNEDETTGRAFQVVGYDKHFDPSLTARGYNHSMTLCQLKLSGPWQFDTTEAFLYTTVEMQPGTYKFKIPNYDTEYGGNKTYYFTSTVSVPVDSQIVLKWDYQKPPASVTAYAGPNPQTNTTAITGFNALTLTEWVEGESPEAIDLGTIKLAENNPDSAYGKLNHIHRARYGSNNYYQSGLRQLLNTDLASNNWWHPTTIFDRPYSNRTTNGYLRSLNEDFINVLATPEITHITNNLFEYPSLDGRTFALNTEYKINTDKVFLLSHTEVGLSSSPNVGTILDYYSTHNTNNDRIKYRIDNGNAYYWWFRTPYPTNASYFRYCHTSGALDCNYAGNALCVAPAHIIQ